MLGCLVVRVVDDPATDPSGFVVVVAPVGFVVDVVDTAPEADELEADELDEDELDDEVDEELDDDDCAWGFVVVVAGALCFVVVPPRSPGCAMASATPAASRTIAAINRGRARDLRGLEPCWEESG